MSGILDHAKRELELVGLFDEDSDYGGMLGESVMKLIEAFAGEGHSGGSAGLALSLFSRLASYEPLSPLTGADDEWNDVSESVGGVMRFQNKRCSRVFKDNDGRTYDIEGRRFVNPDGTSFTSYGDESLKSTVDVEFPYTPKTETVYLAAPR